MKSDMNEQSSNKGFFDGNPKTMYMFGFVSGMALLLLLNSFTGIAYGSVNGIAAGTGTTNTGTPTIVEPTTPPVAGKMAEVTSADHVRGDLTKAKVVVVEYSDFECPFCSRHHPTMEQIYEKYGGDIAWVYRHFPLSFHPNAEPAALASECANEQGKFWEFADAMFEGQTGGLDGDADAASAFFTKTAKDLGLDITKFNDCVKTAKYQDKVDADTASGRTAGVSGTPATFINGQMVVSSSGQSVGAASLSTFTKIIDAALAK